MIGEKKNEWKNNKKLAIKFKKLSHCMKVGKRKTKKVNQIKKLESHWMKVGKRKTKRLSTDFRINVINHCNKKSSLV